MLRARTVVLNVFRYNPDDPCGYGYSHGVELYDEPNDPRELMPEQRNRVPRMSLGHASRVPHDLSHPARKEIGVVLV